MSDSWSGGSTRQWRKTRAFVLRRDGRRCQLQIDGICTTIADCVHHTLGKAVTGDDPDYCVASCTPCNLRTGNPSKADPGIASRTAW